MQVAIIIAIIAAIVIVGPLLLIWSVNTLFSTGIDYTFYTWLAALLLGGAVSGNKAK